MRACKRLFSDTQTMRILNRETIFEEINKLTGLKSGEGYVEIILTKPAWGIKLRSVFGQIFSYAKCQSPNKYGHSVASYGGKFKDDGMYSKVMNISGSKNDCMVNMYNPAIKYFIPTDEDDKKGNEQGGIEERTFLCVNIKVDQKIVELMDSYFVNLKKENELGNIKFNLLTHIITNPLRRIFYGEKEAKSGNCAYWTGKGFENCGLINKTSSWPLALLFKIWYNAIEKNVDNVNVILFKSKIHHVEPEGTLLWPLFWLKNSYHTIWNLNTLANIVVTPKHQGNNDYILVIERQKNFHHQWLLFKERIKEIFKI